MKCIKGESNIDLKKEYKEQVFPKEDELFTDYRQRITDSKDIYEITWQDIKDLCMCFYNQKISDNWRKIYYYQRDKEKYVSENYNRILCISDSHVPFNLPIDVLEGYVNKVDTLIINGDLLDCYSLSKFTKMYRQPLIDELKKAREYVIKVVEMIKPKKIIAVTGNHEIRLGRMIADKIGSDLLDLMPTDAMAFIFDTGFNEYNHQTKSKTIYEPLDEIFEKMGIECIYANNFWYIEGKTLFVHPLAFRSNDLSTVVKAYDYFIAQGLHFDSIVLAHTHKIGYTNHNGYHLYESGCLADLKYMDYMDMKLPKTKQTQGFIYIIQEEDGSLDFNKTKLELI